MVLEDDDADVYQDALAARGGAWSPARPWLFGVAGSGLIGAIFSGISTSDFISHLDRQVHAIHCSFIPGAAEQIGESGCRTVMMSPYSSLFRSDMWGGLPISLLSLAVFFYLIYRGLDFAYQPKVSQRATGFMIAATALPVLMSIIYGYISSTEIGAMCKSCVGIYVASGLSMLFAIIAHTKAGRPNAYESSGPLFARWFFEGVAYVAALALIYLALAPKSEKSLDGCGRLVTTSDRHGVLVPYEGSARGKPALAVLDPLCPACRAFDKRLMGSGLQKKMDLKVLLFPLDSKCNWMVKESLHPGACAVSEAILCDPSNAKAIVNWSFENQESLLDEAKRSEKAVRARIKKRFPSVSRCLGSSKIRNKLNKSLRYAVANALPVLTPQLFIGSKRVCDEDTDLGLEYTVSTMLARTKVRR